MCQSFSSSKWRPQRRSLPIAETKAGFRRAAPEDWRCTPHPGQDARAFVMVPAPPPLQKRYRAVYDSSAADEDEVSFQDGGTIVNVQQIDDGWMYGTVERTGDTGMLPANYVEAI